MSNTDWISRQYLNMDISLGWGKCVKNKMSSAERCLFIALVYSKTNWIALSGTLGETYFLGLINS